MFSDYPIFISPQHVTWEPREFCYQEQCALTTHLQTGLNTVQGPDRLSKTQGGYTSQGWYNDVHTHVSKNASKSVFNLSIIDSWIKWCFSYNRMPQYYRLLSSILSLYPLDAVAPLSKLWPPKISPDIAKYPVGMEGKIILIWETLLWGHEKNYSLHKRYVSHF
jgi:hypothetical protein